MDGMAGMSARDTEVRLPRATKVKNKQAADKQITAEQILRESQALQEQDFKPPTQKITDPTELAEYRLRKRKEYEDLVRRVRWNQSVWVKYAQWEEGQKDFRRARSVWERALEVTHTNPSVWLKYAEMEMRHRFINHARNVWDRAVQILPRVDQLWYKYIHMEEILGNVPGARQIFERWMKWEPDHHGWAAYIKVSLAILSRLFNEAQDAITTPRSRLPKNSHHQAFAKEEKRMPMELRYAEVDRARKIYERYTQVLPTVKAWVRYAKFEMQNGEVGLARSCYERAVEELGEDAETEELFTKFAEFEEKVGEIQRARAIYKYALDHIPRGQADHVYKRFVSFEKQHGDREGIEIRFERVGVLRDFKGQMVFTYIKRIIRKKKKDNQEVVVSERRFQYQAEVLASPQNYDTWFDYVRLEESAGDHEKIRDVYERAVSNVPPANEKRYWQRYIYLWINYALFEELVAEDTERAREVYRVCLKLIPHRQFTFAKIWLMAAQFEIRQLRLDAARKILGMAVGMCPKEKIFSSYINLEMQLGAFDRCRTLYGKYLEWRPENCRAWVRWIELERDLGELERCRAMYELAIQLPVLDMPEILWKSYIDFEIQEGERGLARELYERLLERTTHVKVWLSYASFEAAELPLDEEDEEAVERLEARKASGEESSGSREAKARSVYERAFRSLRESQPDAKEEAVMLLEAWRSFEQKAETAAEKKSAAVQAVERRMPKRIKRKRPIETDEGLDAGMEEYFDYIFPDESSAAPHLKILEAAERWKRQKLAES